MEVTMNLTELVRENADDLVSGAVAELHQARLRHYEEEGIDAAHERLTTLLDQTLRCLEAHRADPIIDWATRIGHDRFAAGYDLFEVQTAINVLEEALWKRILSSVGPEDLAHALGLINAILSMAKDTLARTYVSLATNRVAPPVNIKELWHRPDSPQ
jgi:hypothetical protein